ncbi:MAG: response regulator transcription factor [Hydrogenophaga sp.]|uniref:response regulator transcription factor n=1 Tax=Hydrogenophaga sp. TaxID=1904254 RepID=UPI0025BB4CF8|nr:response regulator transcription factor [Hydrogenophaga sp.]MBU7571891.1 response regulator transcription factor [Hydrogenophaga sp.]
MNLLLIDDHPMFGVGFVHALTHLRPGIDARAVLHLEHGLALARQWPGLDVVLIDYRLAGDDGLAGLRRFGTHHPLVARVLISGQEDRHLLAQARTAGAAGFLGKSLPIAEILAALEKIVGGGEHFHAAEVAGRLLTGAATSGPTARQLEVLLLVARGQQNKQIAHELGIAERTVKLHVTALLDALGARNRTHLLVLARDSGLI